MTTPGLRAADSGPWYREPWPWILMSGPAIVVVAGLITAWIAVTTNDGLVTEDYYKKGLAANQTIAQSERAVKFGLVAGVTVTSERLDVGVVAQDATFVLPPAIVVTVSHPTRAGLDQTRTMALIDGRYGEKFHLPAAGHWLIMVSDEAQTWRLMGNVILPASGVINIGAVDGTVK